MCRAEKSASEQEKVNAERRANDNYQLALDERKRDGDDETVVNYFKAAARDGHALAMWQLGGAYNGDDYLYNYGLKVDKQEALKMYRGAAEAGDTDAQYLLG